MSPSVKTSDIDYFTWNQEKSHNILSKICDRLGSEELWLFKKHIKGDKDIYELDLSSECSEETSNGIKRKLAEYWNNRSLIEIEENQFVPVWTFYSSYAWTTLSTQEKEKLEHLFNQKNIQQDKKWEEQATDILESLTSAVDMQACGEDLGVNLSCVPSVMQKENILGLSVLRWSRKWEIPGQPYSSFDEYRKLSVTTTSVHDSTTIRQWWEEDSYAASLFVKQNADSFNGKSFEELKNFTPEIAESIFVATAKTNSAWCIHPLQDYLYMDINYWLPNSKDERVNVPGEVTDFNWTYRIPCLVEELIKNKNLIQKIKVIAEKHDGRK